MKVGDTVKLKSGGPLMTVTCTEGSNINYVECSWFDYGFVHMGWFHKDALTTTDEFGGQA